MSFADVTVVYLALLVMCKCELGVGRGGLDCGLNARLGTNLRTEHLRPLAIARRAR